MKLKLNDLAILAINFFNIGFCLPGLINYREFAFVFAIICSSLVIWAKFDILKKPND